MATGRPPEFFAAVVAVACGAAVAVVCEPDGGMEAPSRDRVPVAV